MIKVKWVIANESLYLYNNLGVALHNICLDGEWNTRARLSFNVYDEMRQRVFLLHIRIWKSTRHEWVNNHKYNDLEIAIKELEILAQEKMPDDIKDWVASRTILASMENKEVVM